MGGHPDDRGRLLRSELDDPHRLLGPHPAERDGIAGVVVRVYHPEAVAARIVLDGASVAAEAVGGGLFSVWLPGRALSAERVLDYRVVFDFDGGGRWERDDPYRFPPTVSELDLYLFAEGTHRRLWTALGARPLEVAGVAGFAFAVWAPNALRVSLVSDLGRWDPRIFPMRRLGMSGVFEIFVPGFPEGGLYKYGVVGRDGRERYKADPLASWAEVPPATASRTFRSRYVWGDGAWMAERRRRDVCREPLATYEVHLGSWRRGEDGRRLGYREVAERLAAHVGQLGFDSIELMPVAEHPFDGSWGYQTTGYYAPTSRYGDPDDFRAFVDVCHRHGISVILDWVPGHFVKDEHGLGVFDGSGLYEHADPRQGEHPDWGTYVFNLGRLEVKSFLVSNALFWLLEMHVDGLRVDAVASMLYLDYSRKPGEWVPNKNGGRENLDAIDFLRAVNLAIRQDAPGAFTIAEESTSWPGVTKPPESGGLGFQLKWNMGWMHDTLGYFGVDPLFRPGCHDRLTFAMVYEHDERFVNPLSHDEVVHGKRALYGKMPGDPWQRLANLRALFAYQMTRPGKKLLFMGSELAPTREWSESSELDWYLLDDPGRAGLLRFLSELGRLYHRSPCLWRSDPDRAGFHWIACEDRERSIVAYERRLPVAGRKSGFVAEREAGEHLVVVLNLTPLPHARYRIGAPRAGRYQIALSSDDLLFGGSGFPIRRTLTTTARAADGYPQSLQLTLPPLAALVLRPVDRPASGAA